MNLQELIERIDDLSWQEQMEFEMSERDSQYAQWTATEIEHIIQEVASETSPGLLDQLELEEAYIVWALRLSLHVRDDNPLRRGHRYMEHPNSNVRYWANRIISHGNS
jgi:hypothetical protein